VAAPKTGDGLRLMTGIVGFDRATLDITGKMPKFLVLPRHP
jgi:hypothetical protein